MKGQINDRYSLFVLCTLFSKLLTFRYGRKTNLQRETLLTEDLVTRRVRFRILLKNTQLFTAKI